MFRTVLTVAALSLASTSAFAGKSVKSQHYFNIYVKEVKSLYKGLKSYGVSNTMSYDFANRFVGKNAFGWDMSLGTASSNTSFDTTGSWITQDVQDQWANGWTGDGVTVGVIDNHKKQLWHKQGKSHGYLVSSVLGGETDGYAGIAPEATINKHHYNDLGSIDIASTDIINISMGMCSYSNPCNYQSYAYKYWLNQWKPEDSAKGTLFVTSAGNGHGYSHQDALNLSLIHI